MEILQLTIGKIFLFVEKVLELIIPSSLILNKLFIFLLSIISTFLMILWWIKLELKNEDEIDYWQSLFKSKKDYFFIKNQRKTFEKIKKIFYQDEVKGLIEIDKFLKTIIEMFGYSENNLEDNIEKLPSTISKNKEDIKKAIKIVSLIKEKLENNEEITLKKEEYFLVFHQYEQFLADLSVITSDNFLVVGQ
jgi:hypothetical protein